MMDVLAKLIVVKNVQSVSVSNHHIVQLKLT